MRIQIDNMQAATELLNGVVGEAGVAAFLGNELLSEELAGIINNALEGQHVEDYEGPCADDVARLIAAPIAVIQMAIAADAAAGIPSSFMSQINLLRSGFVTADMSNRSSYEQLFPAVLENNDPEDGQILLSGVRSHLVGRFMDQDGPDFVRQFMRVAVERGMAADGDLIDAYQPVVVPNEEVGVDHILHAVNALTEVVRAAGLPLARGLSMLGAGGCAFDGGQAAFQSVIREVAPNIAPQDMGQAINKTLAYMHQFNGDLVNDVVREVGNDWLANEGPAYLENYHAEMAIGHDDDIDYDDEDGPDFHDDVDAEDEGLDEVLCIGDDNDFRM